MAQPAPKYVCMTIFLLTKVSEAERRECIADPELMEETLNAVAKALSKSSSLPEAESNFHREIDHPEVNIDARITWLQTKITARIGAWFKHCKLSNALVKSNNVGAVQFHPEAIWGCQLDVLSAATAWFNQRT